MLSCRKPVAGCNLDLSVPIFMSRQSSRRVKERRFDMLKQPLSACLLPFYRVYATHTGVGPPTFYLFPLISIAVWR